MKLREELALSSDDESEIECTGAEGDKTRGDAAGVNA